MTMHRFDVFGRPMGVVREGGCWRAYALGNEGKRRPVDIAIPPELAVDELATFLADVFHECATTRSPEVVRRE